MVVNDWGPLLMVAQAPGMAGWRDGGKGGWREGRMAGRRDGGSRDGGSWDGGGGMAAA